MQYGLFLRILLLFFFLIFTGCADQQPKPLSENTAVKKITPNTYHTFNLERYQPVDTTGMVKKIDNFVLIFDPSASMTETYEASDECITCHTNYKDTDFAQKHEVKYGGHTFAERDNQSYTARCNECHHDYLYTKFKFATQLAACFNKTIPDLNLVSVLRTFGYPVYSRLAHGPATYTQKSFARSLDKIFDADGASPLAPTLKNVGKDLFKLKGKKAVIIVSDGKDMGKKEILAARDLKARYGDDICIYTVHIGSDKSGRQVLEKIAAAGFCGLSVAGDNLLSKKEMDDFVKEIFLEKDSDSDGVPDLKDDCPGTLPGLEVDENGCWKLIVFGNILFDFDKYNLKPEGIKILDQVAALLKKHNFLDLHISGHTDNYGSMEYNIKLSKNRVMSGFNYIKEKGVTPQRISTSWHSFSIPVASNASSTGRALNRRLEFKFKKRDK